MASPTPLQQWNALSGSQQDMLRAANCHSKMAVLHRDEHHLATARKLDSMGLLYVYRRDADRTVYKITETGKQAARAQAVDNG